MNLEIETDEIGIVKPETKQTPNQNAKMNCHHYKECKTYAHDYKVLERMGERDAHHVDIVQSNFDNENRVAVVCMKKQLETEEIGVREINNDC